jgi:GT2 family glycosyltransferase
LHAFMTGARHDVTVVIFTYDGRHHLERLLPSIAAQTVEGFALHVVDDASTDDTLEWLAKQWPDVRVFPAAKNAGITATMARAIATAESEYVALLNNDLALEPRWLEELLAAIDRRPDAAAVEGKTLRFDRRDVLDGAGDMLRRNGYPDRRGQGEPDDGRFDEPAEIFSASGTASLFRRRAFDEVGSFDTDLQAYYEDLDWGFRARLRGWTAWYVPTARAYHVGSATAGAVPGRFTPLIIRNQILVTIKNWPAPLLARNAHRIVFFELKWLPFNALHGMGRHHLRALAGVVRALPATLRKRRAIQRGRTADWRALARIID